jgi:hypothetical protein
VAADRVVETQKLPVEVLRKATRLKGATRIHQTTIKIFWIVALFDHVAVSFKVVLLEVCLPRKNAQQITAGIPEMLAKQ